MFKRNALIALTTLNLTISPLYADEVSSPTANSTQASAMNMQNNDNSSGQMQEEMKAMQEMHSKMMGAKTPEEKQKLMQEGTGMMQEGMGMMKSMGPPNMGSDMTKQQKMMEKRMDMMQVMMQMMMDRQKMMDMPMTNSK